MPKYPFDIFFNFPHGSITIIFEEKLQAEAYKKKTGDKCTLSKSKDGFYEIHLPRLLDLKYVRCSDHTNDMVFVFLDEKAARAWKKDLALVSCDGKEVRIKRGFRKGELDKILGVKKNSDSTDGRERHDVVGKAHASGRGNY